MHTRIAIAIAATAAVVSSAAFANLVYIDDNLNAIQVVDQHVTATVNQNNHNRGEAAYDTNPATGRFNRIVDTTVTPAKPAGRRYDSYVDYADVVGGDYYCAPTSAYSIIEYVNRKNPASGLIIPGETPRKLIADLAFYMDTGDVRRKAGAADAAEFHIATRIADVRSGLQEYMDLKAPNTFKVRSIQIPLVNATNDQRNTFRNLYDALIDADKPVILGFRGHATVGIGYDTDFGSAASAHYRLDDPWDGVVDKSGFDLGRGRPLLADFEFGALEDASSLVIGEYGTSNTYLDSPGDALPYYMAWVEPIAASEPPAVVLVAVALVAVICGSRGRRMAWRRSLAAARRYF